MSNDYKKLAIDHVRSVCPELMELSFGCRFIEKNSDRELMYLNKWYSTESCLSCWVYDGGYGETVKADVGKIIGHTPHLEHWLRGIASTHTDGNVMNYHTNERNELVIRPDTGMLIDYDLTKDGENQDSSFYKAYCNIVGIINPN